MSSDEPLEEDGYSPLPLELVEPRLLSQAESAMVAERITSLATAEEDACQVCSSKRVIIQPLLVNVPIASSGSKYGYPSVLTICYDCGFTRCFNAAILGITVNKKASEDEDVG